MLVYYNLDFQDLVVFTNDDPGSIGRPCLYVFERMEADLSKTFQI